MKPGTTYSYLPLSVQSALDALEIEDSDSMSPKEVFEAYCQWHGLLGWNLWELVKQCEAAATKTWKLKNGRILVEAAGCEVVAADGQPFAEGEWEEFCQLVVKEAQA